LGNGVTILFWIQGDMKYNLGLSENSNHPKLVLIPSIDFYGCKIYPNVCPDRMPNHEIFQQF